MNEKYRSRWSTRRFTAFLLLLSFLAVLFTGIILYITPRGRVANWTGWTILGMAKSDWAAVHTTLSVIFLLSSCLHLWFNWRPLKAYIKGVARKALPRKAEFALATGILVLTWAGTLGGWQPFVQLARWNDEIKAWWEAKSTAAPVPHEEEAPLRKAAADFGLTQEDFLAKLRKAGFEPTGPEETLGSLASRYGLSASQVIRKALGEERAGRKGRSATRSEANGSAPGKGWGRMTLADLCRREGLSLKNALALLREKGLRTDPEGKIRDIARLLGVSPWKLASLLGADPLR